MSFESLSQAEIDHLVSRPKTVVGLSSPKVKQHAGTQHDEWSVRLISDDQKYHFRMYTRQNRLLDADFSCGLIWESAGGDLHLTRLNGNTHVHGPLQFVFHIHRATEKAIREGRKPESFAEATKDYDSLEGAKHQLVALAKISGLNAPPPHPKLIP